MGGGGGKGGRRAKQEANRAVTALICGAVRNGGGGGGGRDSRRGRSDASPLESTSSPFASKMSSPFADRKASWSSPAVPPPSPPAQRRDLGTTASVEGGSLCIIGGRQGEGDRERNVEGGEGASDRSKPRAALGREAAKRYNTLLLLADKHRVAVEHVLARPPTSRGPREGRADGGREHLSEHGPRVALSSWLQVCILLLL